MHYGPSLTTYARQKILRQGARLHLMALMKDIRNPDSQLKDLILDRE